jgi:hypothetical protein
MAKIEYLDKVLSNYISCSENKVLYYVLGMFGWFWNREKSLIMASFVPVATWIWPDKIFELMQITDRNKIQ